MKCDGCATPQPHKPRRWSPPKAKTANTAIVPLCSSINDIGPSAIDTTIQKRIKDRLITAYQQIAGNIKKAGITSIGATITQMLGNQYYAPKREVTRVAINGWILDNGTFNHTVDFTSLIRNRDKLLTQFDSGDGLHRNPAAYKEMGTKFPIKVFRK
ncbi:hypothetical protein FVEN_g12713 [Fusarium venenatum]|nr:hypothetical protein FVEN_g12713 [Fusarium venenatum]